MGYQARSGSERATSCRCKLALSAGGQLNRSATGRRIQRSLLREQCIDEEFGRPVWILQRGIAAINGERALDPAVVRRRRRRHVLCHGNVIEQIDRCVEISLVTFETI